jgi:hypothetical protein
MMSDPESLAPYTPTPLPSRRPSARGFGRRSRAFGLRPVTCDLNLAGARTPCSAASGPRALGPAPAGCRRGPDAWIGLSTMPGRACQRPALPHPDPNPRTCAERPGAWLVWPPAGRGFRTAAPPAPASRRGPAGKPAPRFRGGPIIAENGRGAHASSLYIMNCETYLRIGTWCQIPRLRVRRHVTLRSCGVPGSCWPAPAPAGAQKFTISPRLVLKTIAGVRASSWISPLSVRVMRIQSLAMSR